MLYDSYELRKEPVFTIHIQGPDSDYYLGLGKKTVLNAKWDMLGQQILKGCKPEERFGSLCEPTWAKVERAVPIIRHASESPQTRTKK